jgi:hypothetical protein
MLNQNLADLGIPNRIKLNSSRFSRETIPEPDDVCGPYLREQWVRMDSEFTRAMQRAFQTGKESPFSASAVWRPAKRRAAA